MEFELVDSITLPGDSTKPNEDAFAHSAHAALVLDGATNLGENLLPGPSDAAWIAHFGARRLLAHLAEGNAPRDALAHALGDAEKSFAGLRRRAPKEKWEIPYASMMLVSEVGVPLPRVAKQQAGEVIVASSRASEDRRGLIGFLWLGDCTALVACPGAAVEVVGEAFDKRAAESVRAAKLAAEKNLAPTAGIHRSEFIHHLRATRTSTNSGRHWLFGPDARAADHAGYKRFPAPSGTLILLATDGFFALVTNYGRYDAAGLLAATQNKGLAALTAELRITEEEDAEGLKFPRFKKSDDATALLLRLV